MVDTMSIEGEAMSAWEHFFRISVMDVDGSEFEIESILCDEFPSMQERLGGPKGMCAVSWSGVGSNRGTRYLNGIFTHPVDLSQQTIEEFCAGVRKLVLRSAGRYVRVVMQGFIIDDNRFISGDESEYSALLESGELDLDDEWEDDDG